MLKRYQYIISLRNNTNAVNPDSNYRLDSGQVRADTMEKAFSNLLHIKKITR